MPAKTKTPAKKVGERLPLLPLKDVVVFPHMVVPLMIGRIFPFSFSTLFSCLM